MSQSDDPGMGPGNGKKQGQKKMQYTLEPIRGRIGASILGPRNWALERENPDLLAPPFTDAGTIPNLKFPYSSAHNRLLTGGCRMATLTCEIDRRFPA